MEFQLRIKLDNAAFADGNLQEELSRLLRKCAGKVEEGELKQRIMDINGNAVGEAFVEGTE